MILTYFNFTNITTTGWALYKAIWCGSEVRVINADKNPHFDTFILSCWPLLVYIFKAKSSCWHPHFIASFWNLVDSSGWHTDMIKLLAGKAGSVQQALLNFEAVILLALSLNHNHELAWSLVLVSVLSLDQVWYLSLSHVLVEQDCDTPTWDGHYYINLKALPAGLDLKMKGCMLHNRVQQLQAL